MSYCRWVALILKYSIQHQSATVLIKFLLAINFNFQKFCDWMLKKRYIIEIGTNIPLHSLFNWKLELFSIYAVLRIFQDYLSYRSKCKLNYNISKMSDPLFSHAERATWPTLTISLFWALLPSNLQRMFSISSPYPKQSGLHDISSFIWIYKIEQIQYIFLILYSILS